MTGKDLKNSILQLAIQGKLVPQNPNEEPASELLARIRQEKERLVKEKKLKKKDLETTPITDEEKPFEIPESWEWCRLKDILNIYSARRVHEKDWRKAGIPFYRAREIGKLADFGYVENELFIDEELYACFSQSGIPTEGDLMITAVGTLGKTYVVKQNDVFYYKDGSVLCLNNIGKLDPQYLKNVIESPFFTKQYSCESDGTTVATLTMVRLNEYIIPLPPLAEQQRIVAKIEKLMPLVEEYDKNAQKLEALNKALPERLRQSVLQQAIMGRLVPQDDNDEPASELLARIRQEKGHLVKEKKLKKKDLEITPITDEEKPFGIPESWEWVKIEDIFTINPKVKCDNDNAEAAFIPMEKIEACYGSSFAYEVAKWGDINKNYTCFADGDVAFAKITPCFQNRKSLIFEKLPNGIGAGTTELKVLRQYGETIDRKYLLYFLESSYFIDEATFKGTANQQRIVVGYLENKPFPLPPLAEQQRIVAKIEELFSVIDNLKTC